MICGFAPIPDQPPRVLPEPMRPLAPARSVPDVEEPATRAAIVRSYDAYGLIQTASDFGIKPSTLVLRLKKWSIRLHGRGWKPSHLKPVDKSGERKAFSMNGASQDPAVARLALVNHLNRQLDDLEAAVHRSLEACSSSGEPMKSYQAGRLEMLNVVRLLVRRAAQA